MKMYQGCAWGYPSIREVEVDKQTESSVWVSGSVRRKASKGEEYFDTWEKAHAFICGECTEKRDSALRELERREALLLKAKELEKP